MGTGLTIYISGLYSGSNPQPGVGIARSLRQAYPDARLIGVESSNRCSGIHWMDFDDVWLQRPWQEIDLDRHAAMIREVLDSGAFWIPSNDLEIIWLADELPTNHPNLLSPHKSTLQRVAKPAISASCGLPVKVPPFVTTELPDWELHAFCREHDWNVWLKGPYYEAIRTPGWPEFLHWRHVLSSAWATERLFLQSHVTGYEESIMLSAYRGELIDCVQMRKRDLTDLGKTWSGETGAVAPELLEPLRKIIADLCWSGGAELEMVRDTNGTLWLLEWNPRFPAWVHGATITGRNLPAVLVERASGIPAVPSLAEAEQFTRVVLEVPVRSEFPLPPLPEPYGQSIGHSLKHPSGLPEFAERLHKRDSLSANANGKQTEFVPEPIPNTVLDDLSRVEIDNLQTPASIFFESTAASYFQATAETAERLSKTGILVRNAYSIKTNPDERLLNLALKNDFLAESISLLEVKKALRIGFQPDQLILNGPAKWWCSEMFPNGRFYAIFCDSIEELKYAIGNVEAGLLHTVLLGVRLRTPNVLSRFGIPVDTPEGFEALIRAVELLPRDCKFAAQFHTASSVVGVARWWNLFESMLRWCGSIEALSGRVIDTLDVGGGWFPGDMDRNNSGQFGKAIGLIPEFLSGVREVIAEPGKALAQPSMGLAVQILEIRRSNGRAREVVVDGSIAELPMSFSYPHRMLCRDADNGGWRLLGRGASVLLGRLCMEQDILASNIELPQTARVGDILVFCDAGAYDRSMSYVFGCG